MRSWYDTRRGLFTMLGVAAAGALLWVATQFDRSETGGYWARYALIAAAGMAIVASQVAGGWTKGGRLSFAPTVFLLGFLHYLEDVEYFGREVLPLVRELEAAELERV